MSSLFRLPAFLSTSTFLLLLLLFHLHSSHSLPVAKDDDAYGDVTSFSVRPSPSRPRLYKRHLSINADMGVLSDRLRKQEYERIQAENRSRNYLKNLGKRSISVNADMEALSHMLRNQEYRRIQSENRDREFLRNIGKRTFQTQSRPGPSSPDATEDDAAAYGTDVIYVVDV